MAWRTILQRLPLLSAAEKALLVSNVEGDAAAQEHLVEEASNPESKSNPLRLVDLFSSYLLPQMQAYEAVRGRLNAAYEVEAQREAQRQRAAIELEAQKQRAAYEVEAQKQRAAYELQRAQRAEAQRQRAAYEEERAAYELEAQRQRDQQAARHREELHQQDLRRQELEMERMKKQEDSKLLAAYPDLDLSKFLEYFPPEDNKYSVGRVGSTRVNREIMERLVDRFLPETIDFLRNHRENIFTGFPQGLLRQQVCNEESLQRKVSYKQLTDFLSECGKKIVSIMQVNVTVTADGPEQRSLYEGIPDGLFSIGKTKNAVELKTKTHDERQRQRLIAEARGQVVFHGNKIWRARFNHEPRGFTSTVYGFVGDGQHLQCVKQAHRVGSKPQTWDGPLLPLADGDFEPGQEFVIETESEAVNWAICSLHEQVVAAAKLEAASEVVKEPEWRRFGSVKARASYGYRIGDQLVSFAGKPAFEEASLDIIGAALESQMALVLRVLWEGAVWWLKLGPDMAVRDKMMAAPKNLPVGGWERWFQTERDMLSRKYLPDDAAFPVVVDGFNRPAMLIKDAGDSLERRLFSSKMTPADVYDMSKQLYRTLQASGDRGVIHGDVSTQNICYKDGTYSLIDWGLACGRGFDELIDAVDKAWPGIVDDMPRIPNWETSPCCCFNGWRPCAAVHDMESLLYCCMKVANGNTLPWSQRAASGTEDEVLDIRKQTVPSFMNQGVVCDALISHLRSDILSPYASKVERSREAFKVDSRALLEFEGAAAQPTTV